MSGEYDLWLEDSRQTLIGGLRQCYHEVPEEVWQGLERRVQRAHKCLRDNLSKTYPIAQRGYSKALCLFPIEQPHPHQT